MVHNENEEIELGLYEWALDYHCLKWRYKTGFKFFGLKFPGCWHRLVYYDPDLRFSEKIDPRDDYLWTRPSFDMDAVGLRAFDELAGKIKTKKDLWDFYGVNERNLKYHEDMVKYLGHE